MKVIVAAFKSPDSVYANGFHVNGEKYSVIRAEAGGDSIWAKKVVIRRARNFGRSLLITKCRVNQA